MLLYQLFRPVSYLQIEDQSKWKIDWFVPLILSIATTLVFVLIPIKPQLFLEKGVLQQLAGLLQILPGFYLAALAAVATFNNEGMDRAMPKPTPKVNIMIKGKTQIIELTRRRMLSILFGYLTFISLILYIVSISANAMAVGIKELSPMYSHSALKLLFVFVFSLGFWQMIAITLFGLYQLCDRMHQPDQD